MNDIVEQLRADAVGHAPRRKETLLKAADEIERLRASERSEYEALGFAYAWACNLLDRGLDPRKVEVPELLEQWTEARAAIDAAQRRDKG